MTMLSAQTDAPTRISRSMPAPCPRGFGNSSIRLLLHIAPRRGLDHRIAGVARLRRRSNRAAGVTLHPAIPIGPPAAGFLLCFLEPLHGFAREIVMGPVAALVFRRWIDDAGDVTAGCQHEARVLADQSLREIGALPWHDIV